MQIFRQDRGASVVEVFEAAVCEKESAIKRSAVDEDASDLDW